MGCGCGKLPRASHKVNYEFKPVLNDMSSTANNFPFWELVFAFLNSEGLHKCRQVSHRFYRTIVVPLKQNPIKKKRSCYSEMLMSAHSLITQDDSFKAGNDDAFAATPILSDRTSSPFFSELTMRSVLSMTSRTPTSLLASGSFKFVPEYRPVIVDLEEAIRDGNLKALEGLLNNLTDRSSLSLCIHRQNQDVELEMTLLGLVVLTGSYNMTELVLTMLDHVSIDKGITIKKTEVGKDRQLYAGVVKVYITALSPLKLAASRGFDRIVSRLLIMGADPTNEGTQTEDKLISVIETDFGPSSLTVCLQSYFKALPFEIGVEILHPIRDWLSCVEQLLIAGAKPNWDDGVLCLSDLNMLRLITSYFHNIQDSSGVTLLEVASVHGMHGAVDVLLEGGYAITPHAMLSCPYIKLEQYAKIYTSKPSAPYLAVKASDYRMLNRLVGLGFQIDLEEVSNGYSILHLVAQQKSWTLLKIIKSNCSADQLQRAATAKAYGGTVLWYALPDLDFLKEMIQLGGSISDLNFVAVFRTYYRNDALIMELTKEGIDVDAKDEAGLTAFWHAYAEAKISQQKKLKALGADLNCRNPEGYTPLLDACLKGYYLQAKMLVNMGVDSDLKTPQGQSARDLARLPYENKRNSVISKLCSLFPK